MLCLPYGGAICSRKKSITMIFVKLSAFIIFYGLNVFLLELVLRESVWRFMIIQMIAILNMVFVSMGIYLIRQNYILKKRLIKQQKTAQKFCIQRDFDTLSGLKNRNSFARLAQQIEKRGDRVTVMVCDIDGLKIINDTLGHIAGDTIIQKAGEILKVSFPIDAELFRTGGDEYLAVVKGVLTEPQISGIQQRITQLIEQYNEAKPPIPLSMSVGFASSSASLDTFGKVAKQADYAMYQEKRGRRDKVYRHLRAALTEK